MTLTAAPEAPVEVRTAVRERTSVLAAAAAASVGAGAIHAAAAAAHSEHRPAVIVFVALAVAQLAWGCLAFARRDELVAVLGLTLSVAAVGGWAMAKTIGLPIGGLDSVEPVQLADAMAAVLAATSGALALVCWGPRPRLMSSSLVWGSVALLSAAGAVGTAATSGHVHGVGHTHDAGAIHSHGAVHPYDPALPVDLSGTPGVTPQEQAAAEQLVVLTIARLPQWADQKVAFAHGFRSIGDGFTGIEHLVNPGFMHDKTVLDPDRPESLVYDTSGGGRRLVAAMYMVAPGTPLTAVPNVGGALVQWHIHDNLCYSREGRVMAVTDATGACPAGLVKPIPAPMVHVWITPHRCGPFAALEGIAGGTIAAGQTRLCDHVHGAAS